MTAVVTQKRAFMTTCKSERAELIVYPSRCETDEFVYENTFFRAKIFPCHLICHSVGLRGVNM